MPLILHRVWRSFSVGIGLWLAPTLLLAGEPTLVPSTQPSPLLPSQEILPSSVAPELTAGGKRPPLPLGKPFERQAAGIAVSAPEGWSGVVQADREEIVRFVNDVKKQDWSLVLTRRTFPKPQHLTATKDDKGELVQGIVENTLEALDRELPGAKFLRRGDPTNIGAHDVGMIVVRYTKNGERRLAQHAIIEANDQLFYLLAFNTPGRRDTTEDANEEEKTIDPVEQQAVETFRNILDSVKLLDLQPVREDQIQRLYRTRSLFVNLTEKKLTSTLIPERYVRIMKDGKDIGYSYIVEQQQRKGGGEGIQVGIRTRLLTKTENGVVQPFPREDSESWMFCTMDRRNEDWSKVTVWDNDGKPKSPKNPWKKASEVGASARQIRRAITFDPRDPDHPENKYRVGEQGDLGQPWVENKESYTLSVQFKATRGDLDPVTRPLPPFYLPQALGSMLPRLLPPREPKSYLVATYVSEMRQVMLRYIDVRPEEELPKDLVRGTGLTRGVPIDDRLGYEGVVTTHWVTSKGEYLGSITKSTHEVIVPIDEPTLAQLWHVTEKIKLFELPADAPPDHAMNRVTGAAAAPGGAPASPGALPSRLGPDQPDPRPQPR